MEGGLDIRFYLELLRRRLFVTGAVFCGVAGVAFTIAILLPPVYRSEAKIVVESQQIPPDLVRSTTSNFADERIQVIRQIVTARQGILAIVDKFGLFPKRRSSVSATQLVDLVRDRISIEPLALGPNNTRRSAPTTFAFTVGFEYENPELAGRVANELVTLILNENFRTKIAQATETTRFLEREVARRRAELVELEAKIADYRLKNWDALPENLEAQNRQLERALSERAEFSRQLQLLDEQERMLKFELGVRIASSQNGTISQDGSGISKQLDALRAELAQKSAVYSSLHPDIKGLRRQIEALTTQVANNPTPVADEKADATAAQSKLSLEARLVSEKIAAGELRRGYLRSHLASSNDSIDAIGKLLARGPEVQRGLDELLQQRAAMKNNVSDLENKLNAARLGEKLEEDQQGQRFQVIEQPITPQVPVRPNRPVLLLAGTGGAFAASFGLVFLLEIFNRSIRQSGDLTKYLNIRPLVTIPYIISSKETRRNRLRFALILVLLAIGVAGALTTIHVFYMPLDVAWFRVLRRFQIR